MVNDLRYAFRMFLKNPGFTALIVSTLALGIGGTTAIFSVVKCGVLDPFPYFESHRLAVLVGRDTGSGRDGFWAWRSGRELLDYQEQNRVFEDMFGAAGENLLMKRAEGAVYLDGVRVTHSFFKVLGVPPSMGRTLNREDATPGAPPVTVLSFNCWRSRFGADPAVVGKTFVMDDQPTTVVGVMPPRFSWLKADLWLPAAPSRGTTASAYSIVGRLKPGVSLSEANTDVTMLAQRFAAAYPKEHPKEITYRVESLPISAIAKSFRMTLFFLLGAVALLLLLACGNVANMLLARATERQKELSIRASLGASWPRLLRQFLVESLLFAVCGGITGCFLAVPMLDGLIAVLPSGLPGEALVRVDGPTLLFTLGITLMCSLVSCLMPALQFVGSDLQEPLKSTSRGVTGDFRLNRLRNLLVTGEVALSLVLLTGAGLLMRSFIALQQVEMGFNPVHLLGGGTLLPETRYKNPEQRVQFQLEALRRVRALPEVVSAALALPSPASSSGARAGIEISGRPEMDGQWAVQSYCSDGCLETAGIPLLQGRGFSEEDLAHVRNVAIVNRTFANKFFGDGRPLGQRVKVKEFLAWGRAVEPKNAWFEIVGVAGDVRGRGPEDPIVPQIYLPISIGGIRYVTFNVRSLGDPTRIAKSVQQIIWSMDKDLPVTFNPYTWREGLNRVYFSQPRFVMTMATAFASLGLALVSMGVYSVLSYAVSRRTQEIGIRMALGAQARDVRRMVMISGLRWLGFGIAVGVPASVALARILQNRIWGIKSADLLTLVAVSLLMTGIGLAACYFPARRATKVDPMVALRYE